MAVRGIDHEHVDAGLDQRGDALLGALADADRGADAQLALRVLAGVRVLGRLEDVLDGDQARAARSRRSTTSTRSRRCWCISAFASSRLAPSRTVTSRSRGVMIALHRLVELGLEAQVAVGDDADDLACLRPPGSPEILCSRVQREHLAHRHRPAGS